MWKLSSSQWRQSSCLDQRASIGTTSPIPRDLQLSRVNRLLLALRFRCRPQIRILSGQVSTIDFWVKQPGTDGFSTSHNRQVIGTLGRPIRNHNLHFSYRDLNVLSDGTKERQRSAEKSKMSCNSRGSQFGRTVRDQRLIAGQSKDTLFIRGSAQVQYGRLSAYAYVERE